MSYIRKKMEKDKKWVGGQVTDYQSVWRMKAVLVAGKEF